MNEPTVNPPLTVTIALDLLDKIGFPSLRILKHNGGNMV